MVMKMEEGKKCGDCKEGEPCGKYHVYVLELNQDDEKTRNEKGYLYVGMTGKTIWQRLEDNWTKYGNRTSGAPALIRRSFMRFRMDLVPPSGDLQPHEGRGGEEGGCPRRRSARGRLQSEGAEGT